MATSACAFGMGNGEAELEDRMDRRAGVGRVWFEEVRCVFVFQEIRFGRMPDVAMTTDAGRGVGGGMFGGRAFDGFSDVLHDICGTRRW